MGLSALMSLFWAVWSRGRGDGGEEATEQTRRARAGPSVPRLVSGPSPALLHCVVPSDLGSPLQGHPLASLALFSACFFVGFRQPATQAAQNSASRLVWEKNWQLGSLRGF